ncbi:MAG: HU family DNA-binding protein [Myxococcales bacterium]|nr:HU family DNA-binding protein [Myxococcales bacterium]
MATTKKTAAAAKKPMTKSELIQAITDSAGGEINKRQVKAVLEALQDIGHKQLKKQGIFTLPGFAKFRVVKKPATKARKGINPFTKEETVFKAKPASKAVRVRPVKACKDAVA